MFFCFCFFFSIEVYVFNLSVYMMMMMIIAVDISPEISVSNKLFLYYITIVINIIIIIIFIILLSLFVCFIFISCSSIFFTIRICKKNSKRILLFGCNKHNLIYRKQNSVYYGQPFLVYHLVYRVLRFDMFFLWFLEIVSHQTSIINYGRKKKKLI